MDAAQTTLKAAEAQEKAIVIAKRCQTPDEVRAGFLQIADLMSQVPGMDPLVRSLRVGAQPGGLDDSQLLQLRQQLLEEFPKQAELLRRTARKLGAIEKKWWQFWK